MFRTVRRVHYLWVDLIRVHSLWVDLDVPDWVRRVLSLWSSLTVHCVVVVWCVVCVVWADSKGWGATLDVSAVGCSTVLVLVFAAGPALFVMGQCSQRDLLVS